MLFASRYYLRLLEGALSARLCGIRPRTVI